MVGVRKKEYDMIYLLTAVGLTPGGSSTVQIYTQTIHRTTELIWEELGLYPVLASYTLPCDIIYLLTAIGLSPGGRSTVHIYTQTIHRTVQNKQYIEHNNFGSVRAVPRLG